MIDSGAPPQDVAKWEETTMLQRMCWPVGTPLERHGRNPCRSWRGGRQTQGRLPLAQRGRTPGQFRHDPARRGLPPMTPAGRPGLVATWAALIVVYVVWGSTYLGIRVLVGFVPPLLAMGVRF